MCGNRLAACVNAEEMQQASGDTGRHGVDIGGIDIASELTKWAVLVEEFPFCCPFLEARTGTRVGCLAVTGKSDFLTPFSW
jgi:hypothetical protein